MVWQNQCFLPLILFNFLISTAIINEGNASSLMTILINQIRKFHPSLYRYHFYILVEQTFDCQWPFQNYTSVLYERFPPSYSICFQLTLWCDGSKWWSMQVWRWGGLWLDAQGSGQLAFATAAAYCFDWVMSSRPWKGELLYFLPLLLRSCRWNSIILGRYEIVHTYISLGFFFFLVRYVF